ncbi:MAG: HAMP domain-containing histidine kinase [Candidatus Nanopelagicales bacterium]|jgi:signal transduction histidine kinase|nr:HAMP domain-containing histidine kinase [Candidatus Nanopelagicales bacterium]MCU0297784.1 HAMP domain-containing histidine kinase [Candidatus Nanopelagicales bacterium]
MYRRLILFGLAVCASALIALIVPLALSARDIVINDQLGAASAEARAVANQWQQQDNDHGRTFIQPPPTDTGQVTLYGTDGAVQGENPPQAQRVVQAALRGGTASEVVDGFGYVSAPAYFDEDFGAVLITVTPEELREGLGPRLLVIGAASLLLLCIAGIAAWVLARRTVAPLKELEDTANAVAAGNLDARAPHSSIAEVENVGVALNRLTGRVQELLREEREYTAELAHQLRTPLTVLSVDVDSVADPQVRERLDDDLAAVHRMVDEIITTARRSSREGLAAQCDAAEVVRARVAFWTVLAEDQSREFEQEIDVASMPVRLTADDLAAAIDILFQNVFLHTPDGTAFCVRVESRDGFVEVSVSDSGPGFDLPEPGRQTVGSTNLGLSIARRLAEASGGGMNIGRSSTGGAQVTLRLGPPTA